MQKRCEQAVNLANETLGDDLDRGGRRTPAQKLAEPTAFLSRTDLRGLGLERRAVDAVFRALPTVHLPGYSRPLIRVSDFRAYVDEHTYRDDRVRRAA